MGVQISRKIGTLTIEEDLITHGSVGNSLVKGVIVQLPAYALSIKEGGEGGEAEKAEKIEIGGNLRSYGDNVVTFITEEGSMIKKFDMK